MKSAFSRILTGLLIIIFLAACTKSVVYISPNEAGLIRGKSGVTVEKTNGATVRLRDVAIDNQALVGRVAGKKERVRIDFPSIRSVRVEKTKSGLLFVYAGAALIMGLLAIGASTAPPPPPSECCPFIYAYDGEAFHLDAEPFGAALSEGLKRSEWTVMEHLAEAGGTYRALVANELEETQYTDELRLVVVDHPAGLRVMPDAAGAFRTIAAPQPPRVARNARGEDILPRLSQKDTILWQTDLDRVDPDDPESLRDELTLEFPKPAGAKRAKLVVNASTSLWGAQMGKRFLGLHGEALPAWYSEVDRHGPAWFQTMAWHASEEMYLLQIRVLTDGGWTTRGTIYGGGPFVSTDKAYAIDVSDVPGDTLTVRLTPPANFWSIDSLAVDYSADETVTVTEIEPSAGTAPNSRDIEARLKATDGSYLVMSEGCEPVRLSFAAPPAAPRTARTVILKASGYYDVKVETAGVRPRPELVREFYGTRGSATRFAFDQYVEWRAEQDANERPVKTHRN